jgi:hypothetical protein
MRLGPVGCVLALGVLSPGCALVGDAAHLACDESAACVREHSERSRNRHWAQTAWKDYAAASPECSGSRDFEHGFKEGFAEYLYEGGPAEPPLLPPTRYRKLRYQTVDGYRAVQDWFEGYRRGAQVAEQSGYRQWVTGPSSLRPTGTGREGPEAPLVAAAALRPGVRTSLQVLTPQTIQTPPPPTAPGADVTEANAPEPASRIFVLPAVPPAAAPVEPPRPSPPTPMEPKEGDGWQASGKSEP